MAWSKNHLQFLILHNLHDLRILMRVKVIVLKYQCFVWILSFHVFNQMRKVIRISFMCLTTIFKELDLFAAVSTYANCASKVLLQVFLPPLQNMNKTTQYVTVTLFPLFEYA